MPYFEGIGDEVLVTVAVVVVILASLLLWSLTETSRSPTSPTRTPPQRPVSEERTTTPRSDPDTGPSPPEQPTEEAEAESQNNSNGQAGGRRPPQENSAAHDHLQNHISESDCSDSENVDIRQRRLEFFNKSSADGSGAPSVNSAAAETVANGPVVSSVTDSQTQEEEETTTGDLEVVHIRLKYLDDTERTVQTQLNQNIQQFKRVHFADDLANNRSVRLISTGYVLEDSRTLQSYGLMDNSVIHVQIQTNQVNSRRVIHDAENELDIGQFLSPILGVSLLCVWIMHFQYKEYFSTTSTVALLVLSVLFLTVVWGQHGGSRTVNAPVQ